MKIDETVAATWNARPATCGTTTNLMVEVAPGSKVLIVQERLEFCAAVQVPEVAVALVKVTLGEETVPVITMLLARSGPLLSRVKVMVT